MSARSRRTIAATKRTPAAIQLSAPTAWAPTASRAWSNAGFLGQPGSTAPDKQGEVGTTGTLNLSGFISGEDYNHDLDGQPAYAIYDEMRRGDAQVEAGLLMFTLRIKGAMWNVDPVSQDKQDIAIADFIRATILDDDSMDIPWSEVFSNALLKLPFGASAHEVVWTHDPELKAVKVKRLAPRLPRTFYRWLEDEAGELMALQQFAPKGGRYGFYDIPRKSLVLHVQNREGNNYFGRSMLRSAYPHWWRKQQLYRIDMVRLDRWGVGIPRAKLDENYDAQESPLTKLEEILRGLRSYDRGYFIQPHGVNVDLLVPESGGGRGGATGLLEMVEHHNMLIARAMLQGFTAQGEQKHGSFGAAGITFEAFEDAENGTAREIAAEFRQQVIKPLCEMNFNMKGRKAPTLKISGLGKADFGALAPALKAMVDARLITPGDDLEDWVRKIANAPPMPEEDKGQDRKPKPVAVPGMPGGDPDDPDNELEPDAQQQRDKKKKKPFVEAAKVRYSEGQQNFSREPTDFERRVFNLHAVPATLDEAKARLVHHVAALRKEQLRPLAEKIAKKDARTSTAAFTDLRPDEFPIAGAGAIAQAIRATQTRVANYGGEQVRAELQKQGRFISITAATAADDKKSMTSALVSSAKFTARKVATQWRDLALENALRLRRSGLVGQDLVDALVKELEENVEVGLSVALGGEVNEAFGLGRATTAGQMTDEIEKCVYSCLLDANSCDPCIELDGEEFTVGSPEYEAAMPPYKNCEGRDNCRCVYMYFLKDGTA